MGLDPGKLERVVEWFKQEPDRRRQVAQGGKVVGVAAAVAQELGMQATMIRVRVQQGLQAHVLDGVLPRNLNLIMNAINDPTLPIEARARLLQVVILRGADATRGYYALNYIPEVGSWDVQAQQKGREALEEKKEYQRAATDAVMGSPALFDQLSRSGDQLPTGRAPATEWMNTMLRDEGLAGNHERRQPFEAWLKELPPETRGRAMYHLRDAADAKEIGKVAQVTGFEVGVDPVSFGMQWEPGPDTHWKQAGDDLLLGVSRDLDQKPEERAAFFAGYRKADPALEDPR